MLVLIWSYRVKGEWIYACKYRLIATKQKGEEEDEELDHLNFKGDGFAEETREKARSTNATWWG